MKITGKQYVAARVEEIRNTIIGKPQGNRTLEREDNIKMTSH
jgi:hypothetical protein